MLDRLRGLREDKDLTQEDMAEILNVSQSTYSDYELEKINIPIISLRKLSEYFGTSVDYILELTDEIPPGAHGNEGHRVKRPAQLLGGGLSNVPGEGPGPPGLLSEFQGADPFPNHVLIVESNGAGKPLLADGGQDLPPPAEFRTRLRSGPAFGRGGGEDMGRPRGAHSAEGAPHPGPVLFGRSRVSCPFYFEQFSCEYSK